MNETEKTFVGKCVICGVDCYIEDNATPINYGADAACSDACTRKYYIKCTEEALQILRDGDMNFAMQQLQEIAGSWLN